MHRQQPLPPSSGLGSLLTGAVRAASTGLKQVNKSAVLGPSFFGNLVFCSSEFFALILIL